MTTTDDPIGAALEALADELSDLRHVIDAALCAHCGVLADPDPFWHGTCGEIECLYDEAYERGITLR